MRSRRGAAAPRIAMAVLVLLGLLFTHAVAPDSAPVHLTAAGGYGPHGPGHHGGHGTGHAVETCALGQPQAGPQAPQPVRSPLGSAPQDGAPAAPVPAAVVPAATGGFVVPIPHAAQSAVLRL
ncbi:hypothetical protein LG634_05705 [Streptomyces bambusae]|uniref:hypothetical protein n=1 Tax=Streptomyces bambusae TaxID=1550616 RepID=UPI001CFF45FF|nr:hypothetical protein [Streptomyces bambusae]MCB5164332.1 hypothetical protein [Streptomyces bambusae]